MNRDMAPDKGPEQSPPGLQPFEWKMRTATACIFAAAVVLMAAAARGDLWLDEVFSISFAEAANSAWEIVSQYRFDNNHVLNTLYLYWVGRQESLVVYRLLAIAAGVGSLMLIGIIAQSWGRTERFFSMLLAGTSYPLILYFTEARGYAPAIFFSLLALFILRDHRRVMKLPRLAAFWLSLGLAVLSHFTAVTVLIATAAYAVAQVRRQQLDLKTGCLKIVALFLVPLAFTTGFYLFFIRNMHIDGGPIYSKWTVIGRAAALALGLSEWQWFAAAALLIVVFVTAAGTILLYRERSPLWAFFPVVLLIAPFLLIVIARPTYLYFRYFLICVPFLYLLSGYLLGRWYRSSFPASRSLVAAVAVVLVFSQALRLAPLLQLGRGSYQAAVQYMAENTDSDVLRVGSDHDFRNQILLRFYARFLPSRIQLAYIEQPDWKTDQPEWIITHSQDPVFFPPDQLVVRGIGRYHLQKEFRFSAVSGWHWFLFRLQAGG